MRYMCCLLVVLVVTGCRSGKQELVPDRRGYLQEILIEGATMLTPLYDDYSPENYRASKLDVIQGLPEAAEALDKELIATVVLGPGGVLWEYNILAFLRNEDGQIAVRHMQVPHARITWKGSTTISEEEFADWWQGLVTHKETREGIWPPDVAPEPALLVGRYTPEGIAYWHADAYRTDAVDDEGTPHPDAVLGRINQIIKQAKMTYSQQLNQMMANWRNEKARGPFHTLDSWFPLGDAVERNHRETIQALLDQGVPVDSRELSTGCTALHIAARHGHAELCRWLVEQGVPIDAQDKAGDTALIVAVEDSRLACVRQLLSMGADPNLENEDGNTAFMRAEFRHGIARLLHEHGADINHQNADGDTALHEAVGSYWLNMQTVELLLELGADLTLQNKDGFTALGVVLEDLSINKKLARRLIAAGAMLQASPKDALAWQIENLVDNQAWELLRELLEPYPTFFRNHPEAAAGVDPAHLVEFLEIAFQHGLDPANAAMGELIITAFQNPEAFDLLLARGVDINAIVDDSFTPLTLAVGLPLRAVIDRLLAEGADVNALDAFGYTPLHRAIEHGRTDIALKLLEHGANPHLPDSDGITPLGMAMAYNQQAVVEAARQIPKPRPAGDRVLSVLVDPADAFKVVLLQGNRRIFPREQEEGRWIFRELAPDTYTVRVSVDLSGSERVAEREVVVDQPEQTVRLKAPGGNVRLVLRSADDAPLQFDDLFMGPSLEAHQKDGDLVRKLYLRRRDGAWSGELEYVLPGTYSLRLDSRHVVEDVTITEDDFGGSVEVRVQKY